MSDLNEQGLRVMVGLLLQEVNLGSITPANKVQNCCTAGNTRHYVYLQELRHYTNYIPIHKLPCHTVTISQLFPTQEFIQDGISYGLPAMEVNLVLCTHSWWMRRIPHSGC
jgi:hypothetical protein